MSSYSALPSKRMGSPTIFYGYKIIIASFFITAVSYGSLYTFGIYFKPIMSEFDWTRAVTSGAFSLAFLLSGLAGVIAGGLSDKYGPRKIITACGLFLGIGLSLMSQISTIWQLYLLYGVLVGIGVSSVVPVLSLIARWFVKRRGFMTGIVASGIGIGTAVMPLLVTYLIETFSWRTSFIITGPIVLFVVIVAAQFIKRNPAEIGLVPYDEDGQKQDVTLPESQDFSLLLAVRSRSFLVLSVVVFLFWFCQQIIMVHIVPHATDLDISKTTAASIVSVIGALSILGRLAIGYTCDRIGNKLSLIIVLIVVSIAILWLQFAEPLWMFYIFAILFGFSYGGLVAVNTPITAELFGLKSHGAILGMIIFISTIGGAIGPVLAGRIFDVTDSYKLIFLVCIAFSVISFVFALLLKRLR